MQNPKVVCPKCGKEHQNPLIDLFNAFAAPLKLDPAREDDFFRVYMAGMHDCFSAIMRISDISGSEEQGAALTNLFAIAIRDAIKLGVEDEAMQKALHAALTRRFAIREACRGPGLGVFSGN